ncbi:MAG TPA: hypothetical protein VFP98_10245 [Candidatus Polarisedimenticolia bacterium]|nr:hypothetical protein [Candidatus Polarisedimenticolia bacterium]
MPGRLQRTQPDIPEKGVKLDLQDVLSALPDRTDLEDLFNHQVGLPQILRLAGHRVSPMRVKRLLGSADPARELRKLRDS